tara:strand:+ start:251 stop:430 length:180 start_codon:yes stop_codon:yes gene_type:complete
MKQLELKLQVKGEMTDFKKTVPTLEEMIEERKNKPKGLEDLSTKMINDLLRLHATGWKS